MKPLPLMLTAAEVEAIGNVLPNAWPAQPIMPGTWKWQVRLLCTMANGRPLRPDLRLTALPLDTGEGGRAVAYFEGENGHRWPVACPAVVGQRYYMDEPHEVVSNVKALGKTLIRIRFKADGFCRDVYGYPGYDGMSLPEPWARHERLEVMAIRRPEVVKAITPSAAIAEGAPKVPVQFGQNASTSGEYIHGIFTDRYPGAPTSSYVWPVEIRRVCE